VVETYIICIRTVFRVGCMDPAPNVDLPEATLAELALQHINRRAADLAL